MRWQNVETPTFAGSAGSAGEPAVVETMQLIDRDGNEVAAFTKAVDGTIASTVDGQPKVYRALLTQTGTDAPVATVLENTLGGTVVWTRDSGGRYDGTLAGAFTANKTAVNSGSCMDGSITLLGWFAGARTDDDSVRVISSSANDPSSVADDVLLNTYVEILVYP